MTRERGYLLLSQRIAIDNGLFVAVCDELGIASCGGSVEQAREGLKQDAELLLRWLDDKDELDAYLNDRNLKVSHDEASQPCKVFDNVSIRESEFLTTFRVNLPVAALLG